MATIRADFISGQVQENPLSSVATTLTMSGRLQDLPTVGGGNVAFLTIDPEGVDVLAGSGTEVVEVTAYTHAAGTSTIDRGKRGTTPRPHSQGVKITLSWMKEDSDELAASTAAEATARASADTTLQSNIDSEATTRGNADTSEASTRASADTTLQNNINSEASTRASADTSEATTRANADTSEASTRAAAIAALRNPPRARVHKTISQNATVNALTLVTFGAVRFDSSGGIFNGTTALIAPIDGLYHVYGWIEVDNIVSLNAVGLAVRPNGAGTLNEDALVAPVAGSTPAVTRCSLPGGDYELSAGDFIEMQAYVETDGSADIITKAEFGMTWVCDKV